MLKLVHNIKNQSFMTELKVLLNGWTILVALLRKPLISVRLFSRKKTIPKEHLRLRAMPLVLKRLI